MEYSNQSFENETVELDGNSFENCSFRDVLFIFAGGDLQMKDCAMDRFRFQLGGPLANGLFALHQLFGTEAMLQIIRGFTEPSETGEIELLPR